MNTANLIATTGVPNVFITVIEKERGNECESERVRRREREGAVGSSIKKECFEIVTGHRTQNRRA